MEQDSIFKYPQAMNAFMTTEHFTLSAARGIVNSEISSRVNLYFTTLSSILIAAAFIAQLETQGPLFILFGWTAIPLVVLLGLFTMARLIVLSVIDSTYLRAINRIRHFYTLAAPSSKTFLLFPPHDDNHSVASLGGYSANFRGNLLSSANAVIFTNSLVATLGSWAIANVYFGISLTQLIPFGLGTYVIIYILHAILGYLLARGDGRSEYFECRYPIPERLEEQNPAVKL